MKEFKIHVPVDGLLTIKICAENVQEAIDLLIDRKEDFEHHPFGHLNLILEDVLAIESNPKIIS
jgi:hypothetical protein